MSNRERLARSLSAAASAINGAPSWSLLTPEDHDTHREAADEILADLRHQGVVLMPVEPTLRLRHEATRNSTGMTAGMFREMWTNLVNYAQSQDR
jgi:hypothetical protein